MEKKTFVKYLDSIFATHGFRKKGNSWRSGDDMLEIKIWKYVLFKLWIYI